MVRRVFRAEHHTAKDIDPAIWLLRKFPWWSGIILNPRKSERVGR